jgi:hypothetical protein
MYHEAAFYVPHGVPRCVRIYRDGSQGSAGTLAAYRYHDKNIRSAGLLTAFGPRLRTWV